MSQQSESLSTAVIHIKTIISRNITKIDGVYNSISTILFITLPPPKPHLTFSLNKNIAILWIHFKIQTSLHFSRALCTSTVFI